MTTILLSHAYKTQLHLSPLYFNWNMSVTGPKLLVFWLTPYQTTIKSKASL